MNPVHPALRWLSPLIGDKRGAIAVEFALVLPVLITILVGVIEFGNILFTRQMMVYAAREAARSYAVGESNVAAAEALALTRLSDLTLTFNVDVVETATAAGADVTVTITVPMADATFVGFLGPIFVGNIQALVTMRVES